ncbi:MAG TPA: right-handed parallel beta-helix repeat-containing protein [Chitinophagaceae bacterium]|nr:right-handed parallel beta-helix repeat-containing protein [Chitinophagaceae bacterium]
MKKYFIRRSILVICISATGMIAMAQATRTWVSGVGDDVNPCSRTAPCKTLAGAISKTATGGEINILDPGGFGAVTITKSITIDGAGITGSILSSATNGIIVNAPGALVTIRNFSINGAGTTLGINGIRVIAVKKLNVENCFLSNFSGNGIDFNSTTAAEIMISNTTIQNAGGVGISIVGPSSSTGTGGFTVVDGCHIQGMQSAGISINGGTATVSNTVISGCSVGVKSGTASTAHLSGNIITSNATAFQGPGSITSSKNNSVTGNAAQGLTPTVVNQQ